MPLKLTEKQVTGLELLMDPNKTRILFTGGSRSGKTALITEYLVQRAFQYPGSLQLAARLHRVDIETSFFDRTLKDYLREFIGPPGHLYQIREGDLKVVFSNGSEILCAGLDDKDRVEKILGNEYLTIFVNEATQITYPTLMMLLTRLAQRVWDNDRTHQGVNKIILDCNPRGKRHWLYLWGVLFRDPKTKQKLKNQEKHAMLHWTPFDNIEHLGQDYIDTLDSMDADTRERMLLGKWISGTNGVFPEFDEEKHTCKRFKIPKDWDVYMAVDFGFKHPFGAVWAALDPEGILYVFHTYRKTKKTTKENGRAIREYNLKHKIHPITIWADHSAGDRRVLAKMGLRTKKAKKAVVEGIDAIKARLVIEEDNKPTMYIFEDLDDLMDEIGAYEWREDSDGTDARDKVIKINDDLIDPLRYIVMGLGRKKNISNF